jgi:peptide chain release factor
MTEIYLHFTAGSGPRECRFVVTGVLGAFLKAVEKAGLRAESPGGEGAPREADSVLIKVSGKDVDTFVRPWLGTVRWIGESPYRPNHKRKNWYIGVYKAPTIEDMPAVDAKDIRFQTMRASGPGGQHVNKTDSAVRATHTPTGVSVTASEERSQHANKKLALIKLAAIFEERAAEKKAQGQESSWRQNHMLERGNEVKVFEGMRFREK